MNVNSTPILLDVTLRDGGYFNDHGWTTREAESIVRAVGDTDCDGVAAEYEVQISIGPNGIEKKSSRKNPYE